MSTIPRSVAAALVLLVAPVTVRAQAAVYTDLASFLAATTGAGTDTFDDLAGGVLTTPAARSAGAYGYTLAANTTDFYVVGPGTDRWLSTNTSTDVITFAGFGPSVRGIGAFFFGTDADGLFRPGTTLTLRATAGGVTTTRTLPSATTGTFVGFVAPTRMTSLTVEAVTPTADLAWPTVNNLVLAQGPAATAVPEPTTFLLLVGAGVVVFGVRHARRGMTWSARTSPPVRCSVR